MIAKYGKKRNKNSWQTFFFSILLGIVSLVVIGFLIYQNVKVDQRRNKVNSQIESLTRQIEELQRKKDLLESGISQIGKEEYVEKIARDELNLQKEGEKAVAFILPEEKPKEEAEKSGFWNPRGWWEWLKGKF